MKKRILLTLTFVSVLFLSSVVKAEEGNAQTTNNSERLDRLEKLVDHLPKIGGFAVLRYQYNDYAQDQSSMDIRFMRFSLKSNPTQRYNYAFLVETAGSFKLLEASLGYRIAPFISIKGGQYKVPVTYESPMSPGMFELNDIALSTTAVLANNKPLGVSSTAGFGMGVGAYGSFLKINGVDFFEYNVGLFNGNGINQKDNNTNKDFAGSLKLNPCNYFSVLVSHYNGTFTRVSNNTKINERNILTSAGFQLKSDRWLVRSEYINPVNGDVIGDGAYGMVGFFPLPQKLQVLARFDYYQSDRRYDSTRESDYIIGVNYFLIKQLKLQLNYTYKDFNQKSGANQVGVQAVGYF